jgi:cell division protein FtsI (penicillin-binding protein 3)
MQLPTRSSDRKRLLWLSLLIFVLFSMLIGQFYKIQILEGDKWAKVADMQHYFIVKEPFQRGKFISNSSVKKGHPEVPQSFVIDVQKFHLYIDPVSISPEYRDQISEQLSLILQLSPEKQKEVRAQFDRKSRSRKIEMWLDKALQDQILEWWHPYARENQIPRNAVFFISDYQRSYPFGKLLGQLLHTIQNVKDEKTSQAIPTGGLELYFNKYLKGKIGKRRLMRSTRNSLETGEVITLPQNGADIYLTINHCLQAIAEEEIEKGVKNCKAKSGWAVMMDPNSGEILALAQYPFFYPADYQRFFNDPELIEHTKVKAITDANEPGSIMKAVTIAVALKANEELKLKKLSPLFDPEAMLPTSNSHFAGRNKPLKDTHFHKFLNMKMAVQKSSNVYMARLTEKIVQQFGNEWYRKVLHDQFGFGQKSGIELPSESPGVLPTPGKKHANGALEWSAGTPYVLAIGHNIQTSSLQILRAYAVFCNGGYLVTPTLIRKITRTLPDGSKELLVNNTGIERRAKFPRVLSKEISDEIVKVLKFSTKLGGTSRRADIWGYTEGGKTGTGDKAIKGAYDPHYVSASFVGFAPAKEPAFVLIVTMDEPEYGYEPGVGRKHFGGFCSAPVFREIGKRSLEYLGIPPDDPHGYPPGDPRYDPEKADLIPEIQQLHEKYEQWNST